MTKKMEEVELKIVGEGLVCGWCSSKMKGSGWGASCPNKKCKPTEHVVKDKK